MFWKLARLMLARKIDAVQMVWVNLGLCQDLSNSGSPSFAAPEETSARDLNFAFRPEPPAFSAAVLRALSDEGFTLCTLC